MENKLPDGAQFLVMRGAEHKKVTCFLEIPIELSDLTAINRDEATFLQEGRSGFVLTEATDKGASIKLLSSSANEIIMINFGEPKNVEIAGTSLIFELWSLRLNPDTPDKWTVSFE
jgi:hypothetical protein